MSLLDKQTIKNSGETYGRNCSIYKMEIQEPKPTDKICKYRKSPDCIKFGDESHFGRINGKICINCKPYFNKNYYQLNRQKMLSKAIIRGQANRDAKKNIAKI